MRKPPAPRTAAQPVASAGRRGVRILPLAPWLAVAALLLLLLQPPGMRAAAQDVGVITEPSAERESVRNRSRPEYDPEGMDLGQALFGRDRQVDPATGLRLYTRVADSMVLRPSMRVEAEYDDNILDSSIFTLSDVILRLKPRLELASDWDNHQLRASAGLSVQRYRENDFEDATLWDAALGGRIDVTEFHEIDLNAQISKTQERLTSQDLLTRGAQTLTVTSFYPIPITTLLLTGAWNYQRDLFLSRVRGQARHLDHQNVPAASNPIDRNQDDRDRWEYELSWRAGYEAYEDTVLYLEPSVNVRRYATTPDDLGFDRNSRGWQILAGLQYNASAVSYVDAAIGFQQQNYADDRLVDLSGPTARLALTWNPTELLTVTAVLERRLTEQVLNNAGGQTATLASIDVDQEIYYRTIASAGYQFQYDVTESNGQVEGYTQGTHRFSLGLRHLFNEYVSAEGFVRHARAVSDVSALEYTTTSVGVSLDLHI